MSSFNNFTLETNPAIINTPYRNNPDPPNKYCNHFSIKSAIAMIVSLNHCRFKIQNVFVSGAVTDILSHICWTTDNFKKELGQFIEKAMENVSK